MRGVQQNVERDELADVRREIDRLGRALDEAATNGLRAGLPARAVVAATKAIQADLEAAEQRERTILAWQADNATEAKKVRDIRDLARDATTRLPDHPAGQAEVYDLLDVRVILGDDGKPATIEGRLAWLNSAKPSLPSLGTHNPCCYDATDVPHDVRHGQDSGAGGGGQYP